MTIKFDLNKLGPIQRKRWRIAYHEIGHVMAYIHCDYPFEYVTIVPHGHLSGHVKSPDLDENNLTDNELEICSIILLAGEAVDRRIFGSHNFWQCGGRWDFQEFRRLHRMKNELTDVIPHTAQRANHFFRFFRKANVILDQYEKEIHVLAHELKKRKTLTYNEVCEILPRVDQTQVLFKAATSKRERRKLSLATDDLIF